MRNYGDLLENYYHSRTAFQGHSRSLELTRMDRRIFTATGERLAKLWIRIPVSAFYRATDAMRKRGLFCRPLSVRLFDSLVYQYAMISIILEIVRLISLSPLLMKIAKYLLLCMKLRDYCTVSNLVHQASITYLGGFITTALM